MKSKTIIPLAALVAVGILGAYGIAVELDSSELQPVSYTNPVGVPTDPSEFGTENWIGSIGASYSDRDIFKIKEKSQVVVKGTITEVSKETIEVDDGTNQNEETEPPMNVIKYTIDVKKVVKGKLKLKSIEIITLIDAKIDYSVGDQALFMLDKVNDEWQPYAGPNGMYKIKNGNAIGEQRTYKIDDVVQP